MPRAKNERIHLMKTPELHTELETLRRKLFDLRSQAVTEKIEDPTQMGKTRRDIARVLTLLRQRGEVLIEQEQARRVAAAAKRR